MAIFTCPASSHRSRRHEAAAASHIFLRRRQSYLCDWGTSASHIRRSPSQLYFMWWRRPEIEWTVNFQKNQTCCFHKKKTATATEMPPATSSAEPDIPLWLWAGGRLWLLMISYATVSFASRRCKPTNPVTSATLKPTLLPVQQILFGIMSVRFCE